MSDIGASSGLLSLGVGLALSWLALPVTSRCARRSGTATWVCWAQRAALIGPACLPPLVLGRALLPQGLIPELPVALHVQAWIAPTDPRLASGILTRPFELGLVFRAAGVLWLALLVIAITRELVRARQRQRLVANSAPAPREIATLTASLCAARGQPRVRVRVCPELTCAGVLGVLRPTILLPRADLSLGFEALRLVLIHELEHVRRRDALFRSLEALAEGVLLGHPGLAGLVRAAALHREAAVDQVAGAEDRLAYAELLLRFAERGSVAHPLTVSSGTAIERRVEMLIEDKFSSKNPPLVATFAIGALILGTGLIAPSAIAQTFNRIAPPPDQIEPKIKTDTDACYELARKENEKLVIDAYASLELDSDGIVRAAHIPANSATFQSCLEERAFAWRFPLPPRSEGAPKPPPNAKRFVRLRIQRGPA